MLFPAPAAAAFALIAPHPLTHEQEIAFQQQDNHQWAAIVKGRGDVLHVRYSSNVPVDLFAVPLRSETEKHLGRDILFASLPAGTQSDVLIDLSVSPRWSPLLPSQYVILKTQNAETKPVIEKIEIGRRSAMRLPGIAVRQLMIPEAFTASLYHAPAGYRMLNVPLSTLLGTAMLIVVLLLWMLRNRIQHWQGIATMVIVGLLFLYQLRLDVDLLRFTMMPPSPVGSLPQVADRMREAMKTDTHIRLYDCTDDNQYSAKFLRYAAYPLVVTTDTAMLTHVFAHTTTWSYENGILNCKNVNAPAKNILVLPDGSTLFSLTQP